MFDKLKAKATEVASRYLKKAARDNVAPPTAAEVFEHVESVQAFDLPTLLPQRTVAQQLWLAAMLKPPGFRSATPPRRSRGVPPLTSWGGSVRPRRNAL